MKHSIPIAAMILFAALCVTPAFGSTGSAAKGKTLYMQHCSMCHADNGAGKPMIAKMMKVEMKALGSKAVQSLTDAEMKKIIVDGKGKMNAVHGLSDAQVADVIAFVRTLGKK